MPKLRSSLSVAASTLVLTLLFTLPSSAQDSKDQAPSSDDQSTETLKVNVDVVQLFFNVKDKRGALIPNLTKDNFAIIEDGKPQTVKYFKAESDLPLTLGIMIDASGSQQRVLGIGGSWWLFRSHPADRKKPGSAFDVDVNRFRTSLVGLRSREN
jgi:hypothetical protein